MALVKISGKASGHIVGGARERQEVHRFTMGSIVSVVHTPINNRTPSADHEVDDLLRGGAEVSSPAVNEGYFYEPRFFCQFSLEVLERFIVSYCRNTG